MGLRLGWMGGTSLNAPLISLCGAKGSSIKPTPYVVKFVEDNCQNVTLVKCLKGKKNTWVLP